MNSRIIVTSNSKSIQYPISLVWTKIVGQQSMLIITTPVESYTLQFSKKQERNHWYNEINKQTIETLNKENNVDEDDLEDDFSKLVISSDPPMPPLDRTGKRFERDFEGCF